MYQNHIRKVNRMSRLDDVIVDVAYVLDTLRAYQDIAETGCCNSCFRKNCEYMPRAGQLARYNCPLFVGSNKEEKTE